MGKIKSVVERGTGKMFVLKRNQIIITALVVMIAVAGYLNYMDGRPADGPGLAMNEQGEIAALIPDEDFFFADIDFAEIDFGDVVEERRSHAVLPLVNSY